MISIDQYFGEKEHTTEDEIIADDLLTRVNAMIDEAVRAGGFARKNCPNTGTEISGSFHGQGDGGFRLSGATTGKPLSSHKEAKAVDVYDMGGRLDQWLDQFDDGDVPCGNSKLEQYGLYREAPDETSGWCHLSTRAPHSGHRTFNP